jgi:phosphoribosyl 1,2-cyclic phosphate phosphodiesterase
MQPKLLFLGTGASSGVPLIGCDCSVCTSSSSFNKRLRPSALLNYGDKQILIDAGPDFRVQALTHHIRKLDGVILTHTHYDHIGGVDDLRVYYLIQHHPLSCLASRETYQQMRLRLPYLFQTKQEGRSLSAQLEFQVIDEGFGSVTFQGLDFHIVSYLQSGHEVIGFRIGDLAFISDIQEYTPRVIDEIRGVKRLVVSALREQPSLAHLTIMEAIEFSRQVRAEVTYLTHLSHDVDHEAVSKKLPPNVFLAYDGLSI